MSVICDEMKKEFVGQTERVRGGSDEAPKWLRVRWGVKQQTTAQISVTTTEY